jgi:hypothetical protein
MTKCEIFSDQDVFSDMHVSGNSPRNRAHLPGRREGGHDKTVPALQNWIYDCYPGMEHSLQCWENSEQSKFKSKTWICVKALGRDCKGAGGFNDAPPFSKGI